MSEHGLHWEDKGQHEIYQTEGCLFAVVPALEHSVGPAGYEVFLTILDGWQCTFWHGNRGHTIVMRAQTAQLAQDAAQNHFDELVNAFLPFAKTQPPWIELIINTCTCPPIDKCVREGTIDPANCALRKQCWLAYLKETYGSI